MWDVDEREVLDQWARGVWALASGVRSCGQIAPRSFSMCLAVVTTSSETEGLLVPELETETAMMARSAGWGISALPVTRSWNGVVEEDISILLGFVA